MHKRFGWSGIVVASVSVVAGLLLIPGGLVRAANPTTAPAAVAAAPPAAAAPIVPIVPTTAPVIAALPTTVPTTGPAAVTTMDDPRYPAWSKFRVGTRAILAGDLNVQGMAAHVSMTQTLTAVNADNVTVETRMSVTVMGGTHDAPAQTETITPKTDKLNIKETGTRNIAAAGKTYPCRVFEMVNTADNNLGMASTAYVNNDVPGGVVEMDVTDASGKTMTLKLTDVDIK